MAFDSQTVVSNGSLTSLAVTLDYLDRAEVFVYYDDANVPIEAGQWNWVGSISKTIVFTPSPAAGVVVRVQRVTQLASMYHKFQEGAQFLPKILDDNFAQVLHLVQEGAGGGGGPGGAVSSWNARTGDVTMNADDVINALGYVPGEGGGGAGGVSSFNTRSGAVTLLQADVVTALGFLPPQGAELVNNVAAVRALNSVNIKTAQTKGYYDAGDGGHSVYYYDAADVTSLDDGGAVLVGVAGARWKLAKGIVVNAKQYGARGNSSYSVPGQDDTARLQAWVNYLSVVGADGYIPPGRYRTTQRIVIPNTVNISGAGWKDVRDMTGPATRDWSQSQVVGTIIYADFTDTDENHNSTFYLTGNTVGIRNMEFEAKQPLPGPGWVSNNTPWAILSFAENFFEQGGHGPVIENVMLRNQLKGIKMLHTFRGTLRNIYGQVFGTGIEVTENGDAMRIENVHLNWSFYTGDATANNYMFNNAVGLSLGRVDNPMIHNFFIWGGRIGIKTSIETSPDLPGKTGRAQLTNVGLDNVMYGIRCDDAVDLSISNFYVYNNTGVADTRGIHSASVLGGGQVPARIMLTNGDFQGSKHEAIRCEVPGSVLLSNIIIRDYNQSSGAAPAISAYDGVAIQYVNLVSENTGATPVTQAFGTGTISGGAGGGSGVTSLNGRTGIVTLTNADLTAAAGAPVVTSAGASFTGNVGVAATIRSTGTVNYGAGKGIEVNFDTTFDAGYVIAYDRSLSIYKDMNIGGRTITFKAGDAGVNAGFIDTSGRFILGYGSDQGGYKLQVNGSTLLGGPAFSFTASTGSTGTQLATLDYVINRLAAGNYASLSGANFSGAVGVSSTIRSTGTTNPGSGAGIEVNYDTGLQSGFCIAYDRSAAVYKDMTVGGRTVGFKSGTAGTNVGFWDSAGSLLIGYGSTNGGAYKLQVNSQIFATSATIATSDRKFKQDIKLLDSGLDYVLALRPRTYTFRASDKHNFPQGVQVGFIAQEVEATLKDTPYADSVVTTLDTGGDVLGQMKGMAEVKLIPLLVKAIQELHAEVQALKAKE